MKCVHPGLGGRWWIDVMWSYSHYVESIAIIPQLILFGRSRTDWTQVFSHISPYALGFIGIACGLALSVVGAAWYSPFLVRSL